MEVGMEKIIEPSIRTLKALHNTYRLVDKIDENIKTTGVKREDIVRTIIEKYLGNRDENLDTVLTTEGVSNKSCLNYAYHLKIAFEMLNKSSESLLRGEDSVYSLMVACRISINYLTKAIDSLTKIFSYSSFMSNKDKIEEHLKNNLNEEYTAVIDDLEAIMSPSQEVINTLKKERISVEYINKMYLSLSRYMIEQEGVKDDEVMYTIFQAVAGEEIREVVEQYSAVLTRIDIARVVELVKSGQSVEEILQELESKISERVDKISIFEDFQFMYNTAMSKEDKEYKFVDISCIDPEIISECIIKGKVTERLVKELEMEKEDIKGSEEF